MGANKKLKEESQTDENAQKKGAKRYEMDVEDQIKKYDQKIKEMAYNLNDHEEGFKKDQKHLLELKEHFAKVDHERDCIQQEQGITDARKSKMEAEKSRRNESASMV